MKKPHARETKVRDAFAIKVASAKFLRRETHHIANVTATNWLRRFTAKKMKKWLAPERYPDMKYVTTENMNGTAMSTSAQNTRSKYLQ